MLKKVLYISPNGYLGGAERFVLNACIGHKTIGKYQPVIVFLNDGELVNIVRELNIDHYVLKNTFKFKNTYALFKAILEISAFIKELRPNIIHSTMPYAHIFLSLLFLKEKFVKVWFQHGPVGGTLDKIASLFRSDRIYFNSHYLQQVHHRTSWRNNTKNTDIIVNLGIDCDEVKAEESEKVRNLYLKNEQELLFITAGRICEWKGYESLIIALQNLSLRKPELIKRIKLLIIGEAKSDRDKPYEEKLRKISQDLIKNKTIEFIPFQKSLKPFYSAADVFFHTSTIAEPFGLVVAEAMAQGTLVVGGAVGGVCDILVDGKTGFSFNSHLESGVKELESIIEVKILNQNKTEKDILANNGKKLIIENYSIKAMVALLENDYDKLSSQNLSV